MKIPYQIDNKTDIPSDLAPYYIESDGKFRLDVDNVVQRSALESVAQETAKLKSQLADIETTYPGLNPSAYSQYLEFQKRQPGSAKNAEDPMAGYRQEFEQRLKQLASEKENLSRELSDIKINQAAMLAASRRGLRPTATSDLSARAKSTFKFENGIPVPYAADGKTPLFNKSCTGPMSVDEWVEHLVGDAPHLFQSNSGTGSANAASTGFTHEPNPFSKEHFNLTKQSELIKKDPALAALLKKAAI